MPRALLVEFARIVETKRLDTLPPRLALQERARTRLVRRKPRSGSLDGVLRMREGVRLALLTLKPMLLTEGFLGLDLHG
jgi:hypothetical protein